MFILINPYFPIFIVLVNLYKTTYFYCFSLKSEQRTADNGLFFILTVFRHLIFFSADFFLKFYEISIIFAKNQ